MRILGIDFGDTRTGLALSDPTGFLASAIGTITCTDMTQLAAQIAGKCRELQAEKIVLGYPKNINGTIGPRAEKSAALAKLLGDLTGLEVVLWDERYTSVSAMQYMNQSGTKRKKKKGLIDTLSAAIILQGYLDMIANTR